MGIFATFLLMACAYAAGYVLGRYDGKRHLSITAPPSSELDELRRDLLFWRAQAVGQERNQHR